MNSYGINPLTLMEYYAHFTHGETEASRHFDFMMLLGVWGFFFFFGSSNSTVSYYPHFVINSYVFKISRALPLFICLVLPQWVSPITLVQGSKIAKRSCKKR